MEATFPLGRVRGIAVGASWSVAVIAWLIAWGLAQQVLPDASPGESTVAYWIVGVLAAVVFLACLLAHELAHALVAQRAGIDVDGITLWMFGGVSRLHQDAKTADVELRIAVVGPATSAALGFVIGAVTVALSAVGVSDLVTGATAWLAGINLLLAVFNLLPAFPLDGGRVLRALLWRWTGDPARALAGAAATGRFFGYVLVAVGILAATSGDALGGVWLAVIGWIILAAGRVEQVGFELRRLLRGVTVADVMSIDPVTAPAGITVETLLHDYVVPYRCSSFPLIGADGAPAGLVTLRAVRHVPDRDRHTTPVASVATPMADVPTASPGEPLADLVERLSATRAAGRRTLVLDRGAVVGIVSPSDIDRAVDIARVTGPPPAADDVPGRFDRSETGTS